MGSNVAASLTLGNLAPAMPTYVYKFTDTGETIEVQQSFQDESLTEHTHPATGDVMAVKKVFQPVGVTFKGSGFFKNDNRGKTSTTTPAGSTSDSSSSGSSDSSSSKDSSDSSSSSSTATKTDSSSSTSTAAPSSSSTSSSTAD